MSRRGLAWAVVCLAVVPFRADASVFLERVPVTAGTRVVRAPSAEGPRRLLRIDDMLLSLSGESGFSGRPWTGGVVYYDYASDVTAENRGRFEDAARQWEDSVEALAGWQVLRFVRRTNQTNFIRVANSDRSNSYAEVGMRGGEQDLKILGWTSRSTILHEIGHALGAAHEHQRSDRDLYVQILTENIEPGHEEDLADIRQTLSYGEYDFLSVMHYGSRAYGMGTSRTIVPRPGYEEYADLLGNPGCGSGPDNTCLTSKDVYGMVRRYTERQAADDGCVLTPWPSGWRQNGRAYYRLEMDRTWLFVPTGRIEVLPMDGSFATEGQVGVTTSSGGTVTLYGDADLQSPLGIRSLYPAGSGKLDYWFWADFEAGAVEWVRLAHKLDLGLTESLLWTVEVDCGEEAGVRVAPENPFESSGVIGGPFTPAGRTYGLTNDGSTSAGYSLSVIYPDASAAGWLSLSRTSGTLSPGQSTSFTASVNSTASGLDEGTHAATIQVRTTGINPQTLTRTVELAVEPGAVLPPVISGRITTADGTPVEGVRMDGLPMVKWTDDEGAYSVYVGEGWSGTVRPFKAGYSFSPPTRTYSDLEAGVGGQDYTGTAKTYEMSGRVTLDGAGLPGVVLSGLPGQPVTGADGSYSTIVPFHWSGVVVPTLAGYVFSPESRSYSEVGMSRVEESYTAAQKTVTVSGKVSLGASGLAGVWLNGFPGAVTTAADGTYAALVPHGWSGTVTPVANGYVFTPPSLDFQSLTAGAASQNISAAQAPPGTGRLWTVFTSQELRYAATLSRPGDLILVKPGTYLGADIGGLDPRTTLLAEAGADQTILEINGQFVANENDVLIDGFTFRTTSTVSEPVHIYGSNGVRFRNCRFIGPAGKYGMAITSAQNILIDASVFAGYGGILVRSGSSSGTLTLRNNHFFGNTVGLGGGSAPALHVVLENNRFRGAVRDGVDLSGVASFLSRNNVFEDNVTGIDIASISGSVQSIQDTFVRNGAGYDISGTISVLIYNAILQGNTRGIDGESNATIAVHHLMHWQNGSWYYGSSNYLLDEGTIWETDPKLVNAAAGDYRLATGSPARNAGLGNVDLGAYGGTLGSAWKTPPGSPQPPPGVLEIQVSGADRTNPGETLALGAKAWFENGYYSPWDDYSKVAGWSSSDPSVLEPLGAGRFRAVRPGQARVVAATGAVSGELWVAVLGSDLALAVADTADPVAENGTSTYELRCTNRGPGIARNVQVTAQLPAGTTFSSASPAPDSGTPDRWTLGDLQPGASAVVSLVLRVGPGTAGTVLTVSAGAASAFSTSPPAAETTAVLGVPDLQIEASLSPGEVRPGDRLSSTLTFRNAGSALAQGVLVEGAYPAGTVFHSASPAPDSGTGTWFVGDLAPGEQRSITVDLDTAVSASGTLVLSAAIQGSDTDSVPADNQAAATTEVVPVADLAVSITGSPDPATSGQPLVYSVTVTNAGPSTASAVTLTAHLPAGMSLVSAVPGLGSCEERVPAICHLGSLPAGGSALIEIAGNPGTTGALRMTSSAYANEEDPDENDNLFTVTTDVQCGYALSVSQAQIGAEGGSGSVDVITAPGCPWTAASSAPWLSVSVDGGGVSFSAAANPGVPRTADLTIAGHPFRVTQETASLDFYTVEPCRLLDTRSTEVLASGATPVILPVAGLCGVPASARAVALNLTALNPSGNGNVALWPADLPQPATSVVNFAAGTTRANNTILALATDGGGDLAARAFVAGSGTVHLIVDVVGYFE